MWSSSSSQSSLVWSPGSAVELPVSPCTAPADPVADITEELYTMYSSSADEVDCPAASVFPAVCTLENSAAADRPHLTLQRERNKVNQIDLQVAERLKYLRTQEEAQRVYDAAVQMMMSQGECDSTDEVSSLEGWFPDEQKTEQVGIFALASEFSGSEDELALQYDSAGNAGSGYGSGAETDEPTVQTPSEDVWTEGEVDLGMVDCEQWPESQSNQWRILEESFASEFIANWKNASETSCDTSNASVVSSSEQRASK